MILYILRHEDRTQDCSFFSPLTENGLMNADKLVKILEKENINTIYSSPFIRTLQTIYPYSKKMNININIEYGLSEIHHDSIISKKSVGLILPSYLAKYYNYNSKYKTVIKPNEISYPENEKMVSSRLKVFLTSIIEKHFNTNDKIIIVTHQTLCKDIIGICKKNGVNINPDIYNNYRKGLLCQVFNKCSWNIKYIN